MPFSHSNQSSPWGSCGGRPVGAQVQVAPGEVVDDRVAEDVVHRVFEGHVLAGLADDHAELDLLDGVYRALALGVRDVVAVTDQGRDGLDEELGNLHVHVYVAQGVVGVVVAGQGEYLARAAHRREQSHVAELVRPEGRASDLSERLLVQQQQCAHVPTGAVDLHHVVVVVDYTYSRARIPGRKKASKSH